MVLGEQETFPLPGEASLLPRSSSAAWRQAAREQDQATSGGRGLSPAALGGREARAELWLQFLLPVRAMTLSPVGRSPEACSGVAATAALENVLEWIPCVRDVALTGFPLLINVLLKAPEVRDLILSLSLDFVCLCACTSQTDVHVWNFYSRCMIAN